MKRILNKALREPLFHFLILGAAIFMIAGLGRGSRSDTPGQIVVTAGQIEQLVVGFARTWQRPPGDQELKGLIDYYIKEEVLYREALALGLDRDDTIVRRRMRQKFEFLVEDPSTQMAPPADQDLQSYLDQHPDKYQREPELAFEQIFFSPDRRGKSAEADARSLLAQLTGSNGSELDLNAAGDPSLLPVELRLSPRSEIARLFGDEFAGRLLEFEPGRWAGPIESSYGQHLVRVRERVAGSLPQLADVRGDVLRDLLTERRRHSLEAVYAGLLQRYSVVIEKPEDKLSRDTRSGGAR
jgi:hypothetical protein